MPKVIPEEFKDMLDHLQGLVASFEIIEPEFREETVMALLYFTAPTKEHVMRLIEHNQLLRDKFKELLNAKNN